MWLGYAEKCDTVLYVVTIVLEEHANSIFRVKISEVRMQLHREVVKNVVTQIHQRV
jgi:hypothetical protein